MEKVAERDGEVISILDGGGAVTVEKLTQGLFECRLTVDLNGLEFRVRLSAREARMVGRALIDSIIGAKNRRE